MAKAGAAQLAAGVPGVLGEGQAQRSPFRGPGRGFLSTHCGLCSQSARRVGPPGCWPWTDLGERLR